jgi:uncharacterized RDD family membrane protein YckC
LFHFHARGVQSVRANITAFRHWTSAAQNGPVIQICSHCGALLMERTENCSFCEAPLVEQDRVLEAAGIRVSAPAELERARAAAAAASSQLSSPTADANRYPAVALEPAWREEVTRRLDAYRLRHGRPARNDSQSGLPFAPSLSPAAEWDEPEDEADENSASAHDFERPSESTPPRYATKSTARPAQKTATARKPKNECVEICIQPELDFSSRPDDRAHPQNAIVPVATLAERRIAGALDAAFLGLTWAGFLFLFRSLGGHMVLEKVDAVVYLAAFYLFYMQYFFLFTVFAGATPGMQLRELTIVRLDGTLPDTRQLLWRAFGYAMSGATFMLGFVWATWDEDKFTWHDRISQTYVTAAMPTVEPDAFEVPVTRRTHFAHK